MENVNSFPLNYYNFEIKGLSDRYENGNSSCILVCVIKQTNNNQPSINHSPSRSPGTLLATGGAVPGTASRGAGGAPWQGGGDDSPEPAGGAVGRARAARGNGGGARNEGMGERPWFINPGQCQSLCPG